MVEVAGLVALALIGFAGGAFGAAVGALEAFSLAGLLIVIGEAANITRGAVAGPLDPAALGATGITASLGLGPGFGPHVAFAGGLAATAFAARRGYMETGFDYHEAKHVTHALGPRADVLVVGGVFGILGVAMARASAAFALPWDPIAASLALSGVLHRIAFGYPIVGSVHEGLLNMAPFERGLRHTTPSGAGDSAAGPDTGADVDASPEDPAAGAAATPRFVVEPWLPHQYEWADVALLGTVVGVFSAFVTYRTGSPFLAFGLAAASLLFACLGAERFPFTHHMALPAGIAVVGLAGAADPALVDGTAYVAPAALSEAVALPVALAAGALLGLAGGLFGELAQRVLYAHADTHLDPPAVAIVLGTLVVALLDAAGVVTQNVIPTVGL